MGRNIEEKLGYQLGVIAHLLHNQYNEQLSKYDLTVAQARVLYLLEEHGSQMQAELQKKLYIKASTMNGIIESLLNKRLIEKKECEYDKRAKIISLSEKGRKVDQNLWEDMSNTEETFLDGFSKEEAALMMSWLKRIKTNIIKMTSKEGN